MACSLVCVSESEARFTPRCAACLAAAPVKQSELLMALAERADVIVDFTDVPVGTTITLQNLGPDEPFRGGDLMRGEPCRPREAVFRPAQQVEQRARAECRDRRR